MALPPIPKEYTLHEQMSSEEALRVSQDNFRALFTYLQRLKDLFFDSVDTVMPASYTDEQAQDAVGNILLDSNDIELVYLDAIPSIQALLIQGTDRVVELTETRVIQNTRSVVVSTYFNVQGILDLQGDASIEVL